MSQIPQHSKPPVKVSPTVANEEQFLDNTDQQPTNQQGTANEAVNEDEDWTLEALAEDAKDKDNIGNDANMALWLSHSIVDL